MIIGNRLRELREGKELSQGDIENRSGLLRCYISRVENGHTLPSVETLEKLARALEVPLYQLFYEGADPPRLPNAFARLTRKSSDNHLWGNSARELAYLSKLTECLSKATDPDRKLIMLMTHKMVNSRNHQSRQRRAATLG